MKRERWLLLAAVTLAVLLVAGLVAAQLLRGDIVDVAQARRDGSSAVPLEPGRPVGQTFVARHDGLAAVELLLTPPGTSPVTLTLHLRDDPTAAPDLTTAQRIVEPGVEPRYYRFAFAPLAGSNGHYYYAFVEASVPGAALPLAKGEAYLDGAAHQDHLPLDAQASFRLVYDRGSTFLGFLRSAVGWIGLLAAAAFLFVVPGWALLAWLLPEGRLSGPETLGLAMGVSLAIYPVLMLWTHLVGLSLGAVYAWLPGLMGAGALTWRYRPWHLGRWRAALRRYLRSDAVLPDAGLVAAAGLLFGTRLLVVGSLETPLWGDGYQHTMIAQLIVDNGGLFSSWAPYADLQSFTYHFGLHGSAAAFHWLTGLPLTQAVLWTSQILNALAVMALYPLAARLTRSRWAGVWAVVMAGLLTHLPMSYANWGRFTQLAGLVILPAAVWLTWEAVELPAHRWRLVGLVSLVAGGLALTHYRVLIFYGCFVIALALLSLRHPRGEEPSPVPPREAFFRLGCAALGAAILFAPWFVATLGSAMMRILGYQVTTSPVEATSFDVQVNQVGSLASYLAPGWWLGLALGAATGLWQRRRGVLVMALWWFLLLIATNPDWLNLPGSGAITNFALVLSVYLPAGLLTSVLFVQVLGPLLRRRWTAALLGLLLLAAAAWGARDRLSDVSVTYGALVTRPDVRAAAWIRDNTPADARFLVNSFPAYGGYAIVGSDGGWWLPLLAGRQTTVPPLNYGNEQGPDPNYRDRVNNLSTMVREHGLGDARVLALLAQEGVTHVYVGQRQGHVNYAGTDSLDPASLLDNPHLAAVYHQDRTWVFEVRR